MFLSRLPCIHSVVVQGRCAGSCRTGVRMDFLVGGVLLSISLFRSPNCFHISSSSSWNVICTGSIFCCLYFRFFLADHVCCFFWCFCVFLLLLFFCVFCLLCLGFVFLACSYFAFLQFVCYFGFPYCCLSCFPCSRFGAAHLFVCLVCASCVLGLRCPSLVVYFFSRLRSVPGFLHVHICHALFVLLCQSWLSCLYYFVRHVVFLLVLLFLFQRIIAALGCVPICFSIFLLLRCSV